MCLRGSELTWDGIGILVAALLAAVGIVVLIHFLVKRDLPKKRRTWEFFSLEVIAFAAVIAGLVLDEVFNAARVILRGEQYSFFNLHNIFLILLTLVGSFAIYLGASAIHAVIRRWAGE